MTAFFDTNVLLYLAQHDDRKAAITEGLLQAGGAISVQVLNEMANAARRKFGYDWPRTSFLIDGVRALTRVVSVTEAIHGKGRTISERYRLSVYDAMIAAAALSAGCDLLYSEDMHDGLVIDGRLTIRNPFA